jgi:hypothetical protein
VKVVGAAAIANFLRDKMRLAGFQTLAPNHRRLLDTALGRL